MKNKDRYNLSELTVSKDSLVPILRVYQGRDLETRKEIATMQYGDERVDSILDWLEQDYSPLDEKEKEYLSAVIKPWRKSVKFVMKKRSCDREYQFIYIAYKDADGNYDELVFPLFKPNTMYKGMELDKEYSLEELGL